MPCSLLLPPPYSLYGVKTPRTLPPTHCRFALKPVLSPAFHYSWFPSLLLYHLTYGLQFMVLGIVGVEVECGGVQSQLELGWSPSVAPPSTHLFPCHCLILLFSPAYLTNFRAHTNSFGVYVWLRPWRYTALLLPSVLYPAFSFQLADLCCLAGASAGLAFASASLAYRVIRLFSYAPCLAANICNYSPMHQRLHWVPPDTFFPTPPHPPL